MNREPSGTSASRRPRKCRAIAGLAVSSPALLCSLALCAVACGGSTDVPRPSPTGTDSDYPSYLSAPPPAVRGNSAVCAERTDLEFQSIEDFELGAAGGWYLSNDVCSDCQDLINQMDTIRNAGEAIPRADELEALTTELELCRPRCLDALETPYYFDNPPVAEPIEGGRCGSRYAMHIKGGPFIEWGGNMGFSLSPPLNASNVDVTDANGSVRPGRDLLGVSFWARLGDTGGNNLLRLEVGEKHTDQNYVGEDGGLLGANPDDSGSICRANTTDYDSEFGCDKFGYTTLLRNGWQQFFVPFAEMRQQGWGRRAEYFDLTAIMSFSIFYPQGSWDFWIDDLAFYRRTQ